MASPAFSTVTTTVNNTVTSSGQLFAITASYVATDMSLVVMRWPSTPGAVTFPGFTQLALDTSDATDDTTAVYYRYMDGSEGANITMSWVTAAKSCGFALKITGAADPATRAPEISTVAVGTTTANTANPASVSVTGGPKDVLYVAFMGLDGELNPPTAAPTNYVSLQTTNTGTSGAVATNASVGVAFRQISASSSDDPGVFTHAAATTGWTAYTVVIHPPAAAGAPGPSTLGRQRRANRFLTSR